MISTKSALQQQREMIRAMIADNPVRLRMTRKATKDNGYGETVIDPFGTDSIVSVRGRIAPYQYGGPRVETSAPNPAGEAAAFPHFIIVERKEDLVEGDEFEYDDSVWRVGPVEKIRRFGGVVGKQAPMRQAQEITA